jgi:hypothetical protein
VFLCELVWADRNSAFVLRTFEPIEPPKRESINAEFRRTYPRLVRLQKPAVGAWRVGALWLGLNAWL